MTAPGGCGDMVDLTPPADILKSGGRERKAAEVQQPKPVFDLQPGLLSRKDDAVTDKAQLAALGKLTWKP